MKKLILLVGIFTIIGCNRNQNDIENIEIINYSRDFQSNTNNQFRIISYSIIDGDGNAQTINHYHFNEKPKFIEYKIDKAFLNDISKKIRKLNDEDFVLKNEDFSEQIFCGLDRYNRVRIKFKNRKSISFVYLERDFVTKKYNDFIKLSNEFKKYKDNNKIINNDTIVLKKLEQNFVLFTTKFKEDFLYPTKLSKPDFSKLKKQTH